MKKESRKQIKKGLLLACGSILMMLGSGCATQESDGTMVEQTDKAMGQEISVDSEQSEKSKQSEQSKQMEEEQTALVNKEETEAERSLTIEELKQFMDYFNRFDNYGFLLSEYESPEYADLGGIFYSGAGMESGELTEEERACYEEEVGSIDTEIVRLTSEQINDFLQMKAGITLADMKKEFGWIYLEDYDCYVCQNGDTNYAPFTCTSGVERKNGIIEIHCAADYEAVDDCVVTLQRMADESYHFLSNRFEENKEDRMKVRKIEEQSFAVELEAWGMVEFASYRPNEYTDMWGDVNFALLRNGERIYDFPSLWEENQLPNAQFRDVNAVAFKDYNKDGYKDVIIICEYEWVSGPDVAQHYKEARIYKGNETGFVYMKEQSDRLNLQGHNETIAQIWEQIELEPVDVAGLEESIRRQLELFTKYRETWLVPEHEMATGHVAVDDLDGDGKLELLVWTMGGTGLFSDNYFYSINESETGVEELQKEEISEWDMGMSGEENEACIFMDSVSGMKYYLMQDYCKMGVYSTYRIDGYFYVDDGVVREGTIRSVEYLYDEEQEETEEIYYNAEGERIGKEEWDRLYVEFLDGKEAVSTGLQWSEMDYSEALEASEGEILRMLVEVVNL